MLNATLNRFRYGVTDTAYIHSGRFHADDMMFAALAEIVIKRSGKKPTIIRTNDVEKLRGKNIIVGDIGRGVYDHHLEADNISLGAQNNNENYLAAACGLLYKDIVRILFKENTETKAVFEAFLDIIEHCDNTSDNNTFSDSINFFTPMTNNDLLDERCNLAIKYCKDIINGFIDAHIKEKNGKAWAIPKINRNVLPGDPKKYDERYKKATRTTKKKYMYVSFNDSQDIKLRSMDTYSVAMSVLSADKRKKWRDIIERLDKETQIEIAEKEAVEWPQAIANTKHKVMFVSNYIPWTKHVKDISAVFVIQESLRGGYVVTPVKTAIGTYRCSPSTILNATGCTYAANENRFLLFETREDAFNAAETAGQMVELYLKENGIHGYRKIYGGKEEPPLNNDFQNFVCDDLAIKAYVRDNIKDVNNLTEEEFNDLIACMKENPIMEHAICSHLVIDSDLIKWDDDINIIDTYKDNKNTLLTAFDKGLLIKNG